MEKVFRCYVEKRPGFDGAARALCRELTEELGISSLTGVRILNRYDVEGVSPQVYAQAAATVFSEPQVDAVYEEELPDMTGAPCRLVAVEALPGQYDQRAELRQPVHPASDRRGASPLRHGRRLYPPGPGGRRRPCKGEEVPHQPCGSQGGGAGQAPDPLPALFRSGQGEGAGGLPGTWMTTGWSICSRRTAWPWTSTT